jgi:hypothetical protein
MGLHKLIQPIAKSKMNFFSHCNSFDEEAVAAMQFSIDGAMSTFKK